MFASFRSRLVISNLLITLAGLLLMVFIFSQVLADRSRSIKEDDLAAESKLVASQVEDLVHRGAPAKDLGQLVIRASQALKVRIVIVGPNGRIVEDSATATPYFKGSWHPLDPNALKEAKANRAALRSKNLERFQTPIQGTRGHEIGAVLLVASVRSV